MRRSSSLFRCLSSLVLERVQRRDIVTYVRSCFNSIRFLLSDGEDVDSRFLFQTCVATRRDQTKNHSLSSRQRFNYCWVIDFVLFRSNQRVETQRRNLSCVDTCSDWDFFFQRNIFKVTVDQSNDQYATVSTRFSSTMFSSSRIVIALDFLSDLTDFRWFLQQNKIIYVILSTISPVIFVYCKDFEHHLRLFFFFFAFISLQPIRS